MFLASTRRAPSLLAKQPLEQVGGADRSPVRERKAQMGDAPSKSSCRQASADGRVAP
jgi:hypothetical protein